MRRTIGPFLLAVVIVTAAFTPFGFWGWLYSWLWMIWKGWNL